MCGIHLGFIGRRRFGWSVDDWGGGFPLGFSVPDLCSRVLMLCRGIHGTVRLGEALKLFRFRECFFCHGGPMWPVEYFCLQPWGQLLGLGLAGAARAGSLWHFSRLCGPWSSVLLTCSVYDNRGSALGNGLLHECQPAGFSTSLTLVPQIFFALSCARFIISSVMMICPWCDDQLH